MRAFSRMESLASRANPAQARANARRMRVGDETILKIFKLKCNKGLAEIEIRDQGMGR